jgi:acetyl esterase/lipase
VFVVSGGWKSDPASVRPWIAAPLLRSGYSVFAVSHRSQPEATVGQIVADVERAVRFIRHRAGEYGIDPGRIGACGGSAGGHLSLMLATRGGPGDPGAPDPTDRESSAVQAVGIFFPVTDLLNLGESTENDGTGGPPKSFVEAFGERARDLAVWRGEVGRELSPIYHVSPATPPVMIIHGDADDLTPLDQSQRFAEAARVAGAPAVELVVRRGKRHGWPTMVWDLRRIARWFDRHLLVGEAETGQQAGLPAGRDPG